MTRAELESLMVPTRNNFENTTAMRLQAMRKLQSNWSLVICLANILHIIVSVEKMYLNVESSELGVNLGFATLLLWAALNKYLLYSNRIAYLPNTIMFSASSVLRGFIGILPVAIGVSCGATVFLYGSFRFMDVPSTLFTFFYQAQGDTYFDAGTAARLESPLAAAICYVIVNNFFIFILMKVALAQVEEGYLTARWRSESDWLSKNVVLDPGAVSELDELKLKSLTIPDTLRKIILRRTVFNTNKKVAGVQHEQLAIADDDNQRKLPCLAEREEIERYFKRERLIDSRRKLLSLLSLDEILWHEKFIVSEELGEDKRHNLRIMERDELSKLLMILLKVRSTFYEQLILRVFTRLEMLSHLYKPQLLFDLDMMKFSKRVGIGSSKRRREMAEREAAKDYAQRRLSTIKTFDSAEEEDKEHFIGVK